MADSVLKPEPTLADLQQYVAEVVKARGFQDTADFVPQRFMLLMEECGEFARAARKVVGMKFAGDTKTATLEHEAADVLIVLLGICNMLDIDLEKAVRAKEAINNQRVWK